MKSIKKHNPTQFLEFSPKIGFIIVSISNISANFHAKNAVMVPVVTKFFDIQKRKKTEGKDYNPTNCDLILFFATGL